MRARFRTIIAIACLMLSAMAASAQVYTPAQIPNVHAADSTQFVSNPDGILSPQTVAAINAQIAQVWRATTVEFVVVAVDGINPDDVDLFATELYEKWGLGKRDLSNGVLLLIAKDIRRATIRTGYGTEGVLPDLICGRILQTMFSYFKQGAYDQGTLFAVQQINEVLLNPEYRDELMSKYANNASGGEEESCWALLVSYAKLMLAISIIALIYFFSVYQSKKAAPFEKYARLARLRVPTMVACAAGIGIPLIAYLPLKSMLASLRNQPRKCPRCQHDMQKMDEETDNMYLTPAEDTEEKIGSVDYDVWVCPNCNETDILPFVNEHSAFSQCPNCGARTYALYTDRVLQQPTTRSEGLGEKVYTCYNCHHKDTRRYRIARKEDASALAAGAILGSMASGRGGGFGGGFGGGSFGGGHTGGGGASGGW